MKNLRPGAKPGAPSKDEVEALIQKVTDRVAQDPQKAATILTEWIKRPAENAPIVKKAG